MASNGWEKFEWLGMINFVVANREVVMRFDAQILGLVIAFFHGDDIGIIESKK